MKDQPIIVASPSHLAIQMLVVHMRAGHSIETTKEMEAQRQLLLAGIEAWCRKHHVQVHWSETPGRRTGKRQYRIAYHGDNFGPGQDALYDALDLQIRRLMTPADNTR